MSKNKELKGTLNSLAAEVTLLKGSRTAFNNLYKQVKADEALDAIVSKDRDIELFSQGIKKEVSQLLSRVIIFENEHEPDNTDKRIRKQGASLREELIAVRHTIIAFTDDINNIIKMHPYLEKPFNVERYRSNKTDLNYFASIGTIKRLEERLNSFPEEAQDRIKESIQSEKTQFEDNVEQLQTLAQRIEEIEEDDPFEAFRILCVEGKELQSNNIQLSKKLSKAEEDAVQQLISELRKDFLEDYYDIIRLYPNDSDQVITAENARRETEEDSFTGYYGEEFSAVQTLENIYSGKRILASVDG